MSKRPFGGILRVGDNPPAGPGKHYNVRTKPLARQTLRVRVGRGLFFDRLLPRCRRSSILGDAPLWDAHNRALEFTNVPWDIDLNSNNGPRLPQTRIGFLLTALSKLTRRSTFLYYLSAVAPRQSR
jgi:hypothetical protein